MSELRFLHSVLHYFSDDLSPVGCVAGMDRHRKTSALGLQNFRALEDPVGFVFELREIFNLRLDDGEVFSGKVDFVDHDVSREDKRVAGDVLLDLVDISRDDLGVGHFLELLVPQDSDPKLFLGHLSDLAVVVVLDDVVDSVHCQAESEVRDCVDVQFLDEPHTKYEILKEKQRFRHYLEHLPEVPWDLDPVLVLAQKDQTLLELFLGQSCLQELCSGRFRRQALLLLQ